MSDDDGSYDPYSEDYDETTMDIIVETLTGTTFEMSVAPDDTIISIKSKIHRVEGIPVSQQHLLYRLKELNDDDRLSDHGVTAGATLRLVLSMRGGPISTRRLASNEHNIPWRELKEYVDTTREDLIDKLPPGSKVTVLLFRDGENINVIRVIENEDGTCYPYSDWPPSSRNSVAAGRESPQTKYRERTNENNVMLRKVIELKKKMEGLSLMKKSRKPQGATSSKSIEELNNKKDCNVGMSSTLNETISVKDDEENASCAGFYPNASMSSSTSARCFGDSALRMDNSHVPDLYSDRFLFLEQRRNSRTNCSHRSHHLEPPLSKPDSSLPRNCTIQAPSIAILEEEPENSHKKDSDFKDFPPSPISVPSGDANTITMSQMPSMPGSSRHLVHLAHTFMTLKEHTERPKTNPEKFDMLVNDDRSNINFYNNTSERRSPLYGRRARIERIRNSGTTQQETNSSGIEADKYGGYSNLGYIANLEKFQNDELPIKRQITPQYGRRNYNFLSNTYENLKPLKLPRRRCKNNPDEEQTEKKTDQTAPTTSTASTSTKINHNNSTILPSIVPKKASKPRCAFCNKRLNITTIHTCRCGGIFCSQHRYSEVHGCQYDYKTEGKKILEQANPLVAAPKLPKI